VRYPNEDKEIITWSLKQIVDVNSVLYDDFDDSNDGVELYARHFRTMRLTAHLSHSCLERNSKT